MTNEPNFKGHIGRYTSESTPHWPDPPQPAPGSPNVVFVMLDDVGFAHLGSYGSSMDTPNMDRLAANGIRYNNFHTTTLCSPSRACLLTGRNHHSVGMRTISNYDTGFPSARGAISAQRRYDPPDTPAERLQHRRLRQVARGAHGRRLGRGAVPQLAAGEGLRALLRLPRRAHRPVRPRAHRR